MRGGAIRRCMAAWDDVKAKDSERSSTFPKALDLAVRVRMRLRRAIITINHCKGNIGVETMPSVSFPLYFSWLCPETDPAKESS